jgi:hypothetical protein
MESGRMFWLLTPSLGLTYRQRSIMKRLTYLPAPSLCWAIMDRRLTLDHRDRYKYPKQPGHARRCMPCSTMLGWMSSARIVIPCSVYKSHTYVLYNGTPGHPVLAVPVSQGILVAASPPRFQAKCDPGRLDTPA